MRKQRRMNAEGHSLLDGPHGAMMTESTSAQHLSELPAHTSCSIDVGARGAISSSCSGHTLDFPYPPQRDPACRPMFDNIEAGLGDGVSEQRPGPHPPPSPVQGPWPLSLLSKGWAEAGLLPFWLQRSPGTWMRPVCSEITPSVKNHSSGTSASVLGAQEQPTPPPAQEAAGAPLPPGGVSLGS